jgi:hypothetical protein
LGAWFGFGSCEAAPSDDLNVGDSIDRITVQSCLEKGDGDAGRKRGIANRRRKIIKTTFFVSYDPPILGFGPVNLAFVKQKSERV